MLYASLVGPMLGIYYPLPFDDAVANAMALQTSKLKDLWCSVYTREEAEQAVHLYGGIVLPDEYARRLDYDSHAVTNYLRRKASEIGSPQAPTP